MSAADRAGIVVLAAAGAVLLLSATVKAGTRTNTWLLLRWRLSRALLGITFLVMALAATGARP